MAAFKVFINSGKKDQEFGKFLDWFVKGGNEMEIDGKTWEMLNITSRSSKDVGVVHGKLFHLIALTEYYFEEMRQAA